MLEIERFYRKMNRARMASEPLPKDVISVKLIARNWGIERYYMNSKGIEICSPAPFLCNENR